MYEKLIQALRCCADDNIPCAKCPRQAKCIEERSMNGLFPEAADAIEELGREYESIAKSLTESVELVRKLQSPRWIPVTERLPMEGEPVFVHIPCKYRKTNSVPMIAYLEQRTWKEYESHRQVYNMTHWMPLPEPPQEET